MKECFSLSIRFEIVLRSRRSEIFLLHRSFKVCCMIFFFNEEYKNSKNRQFTQYEFPKTLDIERTSWRNWPCQKWPFSIREELSSNYKKYSNYKKQQSSILPSEILKFCSTTLYYNDGRGWETQPPSVEKLRPERDVLWPLPLRKDTQRDDGGRAKPLLGFVDGLIRTVVLHILIIASLIAVPRPATSRNTSPGINYSTDLL